MTAPWAIVVAAVIIAGGANSPLAGQVPTPFQRCVAQSLPRLDDQISPANVIADGVVESCRAVLRKSESQMNANAFEIMVALLKQDTLPDVLEFRAAQRSKSR